VQDHVDVVLEEWRRELPTADFAPVAVVGRIGRAAALLDRGLNDVFARHGLDRAAWDVLATLRRAGRPYLRTPTELAEAVMRSTGGMTRILDRMEAQGLIERLPHPEDRRGLLVGLTPEGRRRYGAAGREHLANERRLVAALTAPEQEQLAALLRTLLISLEDKKGLVTHDDDRRIRGRA
jgi:DNA-binding MarR family transcriptional regulator